METKMNESINRIFNIPVFMLVFIMMALYCLALLFIKQYLTLWNGLCSGLPGQRNAVQFSTAGEPMVKNEPLSSSFFPIHCETHSVFQSYINVVEIMSSLFRLMKELETTLNNQTVELKTRCDHDHGTVFHSRHSWWRGVR
jgi:hypothetical protein